MSSLLEHDAPTRRPAYPRLNWDCQSISILEIVPAPGNHLAFQACSRRPALAFPQFASSVYEESSHDHCFFAPDSGFPASAFAKPRSHKPDVGIWCAPSPAWRPQTTQSVGFKACDAGRALSPNRADFRRPASHSLNTSTRAQRGQNTARTSSQEPPNKRKQPPPSIKAKQRLSTITAPGAATWRRTAPTSPARLSGERERAPRRAGVIPGVVAVARFLRVWPPVPLGARRCVR